VASAVIPKGTVFADQSGKLEYTVTVATTVTETNFAVPVVANENGYEYNMEAGVELEFRDEPVSGVASVKSLLITGGVASSALYRRLLTERCAALREAPEPVFGDPALSGDNAVGTALIGRQKILKTDGGEEKK
jgi:tRNA A37 threonylcarbamoyltransferase TsaD